MQQRPNVRVPAPGSTQRSPAGRVARTNQLPLGLGLGLGLGNDNGNGSPGQHTSTGWPPSR